ncbi:uncharacterized protein CTRU02_202654 [Colletotrichum truncatum]|uniref:Uncharacterized protein n=1 Tax=Colletotrichum truncatum TaxID=5467 RepID=A0ACC3ZLE2_COLTU|nr:uncharacterized protein CTRU02_10577 [Colletotrichum truncatum]KAF6786878.1 hypothetical protein CTRU02_10577 [Colletotrichum truncatum]
MTSVPATLGVYDHDWYKRNSREDPEDTADIDPTVTPIDTTGQNGGPDTAIDEKTKTAKRGKDLSTAYIASQRHGGLHAPLMNVNLGRPPPKLEHSGDWKFIEFIPEWTDPLWYDSKLEVEASDPHHRIIRPHNLLRHLRPAQLPMDRIHNPTAMALRYGIFPGRTDGRSRMTPTRSTFRRFAVEGVPRDDIHGLYIAQQAKALAVRSGVGDVDDLLKKYSAMDSNARSRISARDEFVLQAMQDMQDDEDWQSTFFFGITTNDVSSAFRVAYESY